MKIHIVCAALPPLVDGIGDYSANIAQELAKSAQVKVLTALGPPPSPIPGVVVAQVFRTDRPSSVRDLLPVIAAETPDWVLLQYNPFSYGRWGLNLHLPRVMRGLQRASPASKFALMMHEPFVPINTARFAVMATWQRWQLWRLGHAADVMFCSIEPWARRFTRWFPNTAVCHLPVGSNIPQVSISRPEARQRLGIAEGTLVLGLFGTAHQARLLHWVRDAAQSVQRTGQEILVLYMGPHGNAIRQALAGLPVLAEGPLPSDEISRRFAALDISLAPFVDGVSTRRTSLMTALQHGVATVGTRGELTDTILGDADREALLLADVSSPDEFSAHVRELAADVPLRERLGRNAQSLYRNEFDWEVTAARSLSAMGGRKR